MAQKLFGIWRVPNGEEALVAKVKWRWTIAGKEGKKGMMEKIEKWEGEMKADRLTEGAVRIHG